MFRFITLILEIPDRMCCNDASAPKISQNWVKPIGISKAKKNQTLNPWKFHMIFS